MPHIENNVFMHRELMPKPDGRRFCKSIREGAH